LASNLEQRRSWLPLVGAILVFTHLVPFAIALRRMESASNYRQERLMRLAEDITDPKNDVVYDAVGMVPTRSIADPRSYLQSNKGIRLVPGASIQNLLAVKTPAVVIPNSSNDGIHDQSQSSLRERYVALADDFLVLGKILPPGGGTFKIVHPGRYRISTLEGSDLAGTYPDGMKGLMTPADSGNISGTIDGVPLSNHPVVLCQGEHRIETTPGLQAAVVWMGPRLERVHRIGRGNPRGCFDNP
jgi:hypothetical protein